MRLITWNCRSGTWLDRMADLSPLAPDLAFLQECHPAPSPMFENGVVRRTVNSHKGIAVGSPSQMVSCHDLLLTPSDQAAGTVAVRVRGLMNFTLLGLWTHAPNYVGDALENLQRLDRLGVGGDLVVMGDLNVGTALTSRIKPSDLCRLEEEMARRRLVSAYHAHFNLAFSQEVHPTYFHRFKREEPWHIDFCFVPVTWRERIARVDVIDGPEWERRSDHRPLVVDLSAGDVG